MEWLLHKLGVLFNIIICLPLYIQVAGKIYGKRNSYTVDTTLKEVIEDNYPKLLSDPAVNLIARAEMEFGYGAPLKDISAKLFYSDDEYIGNEDVFMNGYQGILDG